GRVEMKALAFNEFGGPEKLRLQDVPDPKAAPGEVVVRVRACALNHLDIFVREGIPALKTPLPFWTGCDIAGDVAEVGPDVTGLRVGDRVCVNPNLTCGRCEFCIQGEDSLCVRYGIVGEHLPGGLAELVAVSAENVLPLPPDVHAVAPVAPEGRPARYVRRHDRTDRRDRHPYRLLEADPHHRLDHGEPARIQRRDAPVLRRAPQGDRG